MAQGGRGPASGGENGAAPSRDLKTFVNSCN